MARKRANLSDLLNDLTFKTTFQKYELIFLNSHEWEGLPDGIEGRFIERFLFDRGFSIFFRADRMGHMCLEANHDGRLNVYKQPLGYNVFGFNFHQHVDADDCVVIRNNLLNIPTRDFLMHYVNKIVEAERTMDVNIKACKTPVVFACDDKDVLTFKNMFRQVDGNVPAIFADRALNLDSIQSFMTGIKFMGNELMDYKRSVESDLLTFMGENNTPVDKKERLITDEAEANNQLIQSFADIQLATRQQACEEINAKFGLNVSVRRKVVEKPVEDVENPEVGNDE